MKTYVMTTGVLFVVLTFAHLLRMIQERQMATEPWYVFITVAAAALSVWAGWLVRPSRRGANS